MHYINSLLHTYLLTYTGISSGPNTRYRVWEAFYFTFPVKYKSFNYLDTGQQQRHQTNHRHHPSVNDLVQMSRYQTTA